MIEHAGFFFEGTHDSPVFTAPELQTVRTKFFGVRGESEIRGEAGGRNITCRIRLHNKYTDVQQLMDKLDQIDDQVGAHADLRFYDGAEEGFAGGLPRTFQHCTFEGFANEQGQESGPLPDFVGLLDGAKPSWWIVGTLTWRQNTVAGASGTGGFSGDGGGDSDAISPF